MNPFLRLISLIVVLSFAPPAGAQRSGAGSDDAARSGLPVRQAFADAAAPVVKATASIVIDGRQAALGVIVSPEGHVLTKASELTGPISVRTSDGKLFKADILGCALEHDLAMIRITGPAAGAASRATRFTPISFADGEDVAVGRMVAAVGTSPTPLDVGVISVGRRMIPADAVMGVLLEDHMAGVGAKVLQVSRGSGAARAGVQEGDLIVRIDDKHVRTREDVNVALSRKVPGQTIKVRVARDGEESDREILLAKRPPLSPRSNRQNRMGGRLSDRSHGFAAVLQHDMVKIDPSQCGSAIVTLDGRVAGLNIARAGRTETYAIPAAVVAALVPDLMAGKFPPTTNPSFIKPDALAADASESTTQPASDEP